MNDSDSEHTIVYGKSKTTDLMFKLFIYGISCTFIVLFCFVAFVTFKWQDSLQDVRDAIMGEKIALSRQLELQGSLANCETENSNLKGRVQSFENMLVHPHKSAIKSSILEFLEQRGKGGGDLTVEEYKKWLKFE